MKGKNYVLWEGEEKGILRTKRRRKEEESMMEGASTELREKFDKRVIRRGHETDREGREKKTTRRQKGKLLFESNARRIGKVRTRSG